MTLTQENLSFVVQLRDLKLITLSRVCVVGVVVLRNKAVIIYYIVSVLCVCMSVFALERGLPSQTSMGVTIFSLMQRKKRMFIDYVGCYITSSHNSR